MCSLEEMESELHAIVVTVSSRLTSAGISSFASASPGNEGTKYRFLSRATDVTCHCPVRWLN